MDDIQWSLDQIGMRQLEVFHAVADTGSFSEAARRLDLRQPTVSNHVKQLEELLDTTLILREQGEVRLTPLGKLCYDKLRAVEAAKDDFRQALMEFFQSEEGTIHIGASTIPGEVLLPRLLTDFKREFPDVEVVLEVSDSADIARRVKDGELRYGVIGKRIDQDQLTLTPLFEDEMILVGHQRFQRDTSLSIEDLSDVPYVDRLPGSATRESVENFLEEQGHDPDTTLNRTVQLETVQAVRESVLNGLGVSFLPYSMVYPELNRGDLVALECNFRMVKREFFGLSNRFLGLSPLLESFESYLGEHWQKEIG